MIIFVNSADHGPDILPSAILNITLYSLTIYVTRYSATLKMQDHIIPHDLATLIVHTTWAHLTYYLI